MKKKSKQLASWLLVIIFFLMLELFSGPAPLTAQNVNLGVSFADGRLLGFYFSISKYFNVPSETVIDIRSRYRLADEELPVVFFIARQARVEPALIINLRLKGLTWWDISVHFGLSPEIFYMPVTVVKIGPPYGRAYGYYRHYRGQKKWGEVILTDDDIINLVNLKFIAETHRVEPERVMEMRARGLRFVDIHDTIQMEKNRGQAQDRGKAEKQKGKSGKKGKGKNKNK
ncbi:MAG TPA: hypothetical protein PKH53_01650 [Candidatus Saccharicenans sp.]|nr:hypothetical protein [Candidatus Saccharicenans sp.]HNT00484.1 hypothetical protein [Candidatus Saccharicenans sp.]